jgi:hypothetical protein
LLDVSNVAYEESGINECGGEMRRKYTAGPVREKRKTDDYRAGREEERL